MPGLQTQPYDPTNLKFLNVFFFIEVIFKVMVNVHAIGVENNCLYVTTKVPRNLSQFLGHLQF